MFWNKKYGTVDYLLVLENRLEKDFIYLDFLRAGSEIMLSCLFTLYDRFEYFMKRLFKQNSLFFYRHVTPLGSVVKPAYTLKILSINLHFSPGLDDGRAC